MSQELQEKLQAALGSGFTLERELGGGGMSRVFLAEDTSLGRKIVAKILPGDTAAGVSVERFKREIQVVARLQHPHIVPILTAGQVGGSDATTPLPYYTMPYVKGESLRTRLERGGELSVNEVVHIMRDVAAALAYAHREGVVHRDIKPDNVIVSGGVAVVTDFGVSKAVDVAASDAGRASSGLTSLGVALGTPAYMSPEQASADPHVDHRADIYSFGILAYELLAGTSPFAGRPLNQILAAQVNETPDPIQKRRPNVSPALSALVMRCLEKRPGDRPQAADELLQTLDGIATTPSGGSPPTAQHMAAGRSRSKRVAIGAVVVGVAGAGYFLLPSLMRVRPYVPGAWTPIAVSPELEGEPAISPDGSLVAFTAATATGGRIFVRQIDGGRANLLTAEPAAEQGKPTWSPDGSRISFTANGAVFVVPTHGGTAKRLTDGVSHAWSPDGKAIAVSRATEIWHFELEREKARLLVSAREAAHSPSWSPNGRLVSYVSGNIPSLSNLSVSSVWTVPAAGGEPVRVSDSTHVNLSPVWASDGKSVMYVSTRDGTRDVYQQAVRASGSPVGAPERLTTSLGAFHISVSSAGTRLAFDVVRNYSNIWSVAIAPTGPSAMSAARQITRENQHIESMGVSPDAKWLSYDSDRDGNANIYRIRLDGGEPVVVTSNKAPEFAPYWSPDGREIAFHSRRTATRDIFVIGAEGNAEQQLTNDAEQDYFPSWSPDGRSIAYQRGNGGVAGVGVITRENGRWGAPRSLTSQGLFPDWSPDGTTIAFGCPGGVCLVPAGGGEARLLEASKSLGYVRAIRWRGDPTTLYAWARDTIWAVPLRGGRARPILGADERHEFGRWDFATDGKRLYFTLAQWERDVSVMELKR